MRQQVRRLTLAVVGMAAVALPVHSQTPVPAALVPGQSVTGRLSPGEKRSYSLPLHDGDYVQGSLTARGEAVLAVYFPDGSPLGRFAPAVDGKQDAIFVARGAGAYRLEVSAKEKPADYELRVDSITSLDERLKPQPWTDPDPSPRIQALRRQIAAGNTSTEAFWKQITQEGTPLFEPLAGDSNYELVTFLWRATIDTRNVLVVGTFKVPERTPLDYQMHPLAGTDVWYLTVKLLKGARFEYRLSPNDPLAWDGPRAFQRRVTRQGDPLNPHRWDCDPGDTLYECSSAAESPAAAPQCWMIKKPGTPEGKVEKQQVHSDIQKLDRTISIYLPPGYRADGEPNRLLVLFDGDDYLDPGTAMPTTMDNLIAAGKIPPTVGVLVYNVKGRRLKDLVDGPEFTDFVAKELVPWVQAHYNVTRDPAQTVVGGYSAGGLEACYLALRYSNLFGNVLSQSGAVWWSPEQDIDHRDTIHETNVTAKQFAASPRLPVKFYLEAGTFESSAEGNGGAILEHTRQLRDVLVAKGYEVHYHQFLGGHDGLSWRGDLADGLMALIGHN